MTFDEDFIFSGTGEDFLDFLSEKKNNEKKQ